jgi:hypothetical protein
MVLIYAARPASLIGTKYRWVVNFILWMLYDWEMGVHRTEVKQTVALDRGK